MQRHIATLKALADETRFQILEQLRQQKLCGKALAARLNISEAAVSQHIRILKEARLIEADKKGYWTHYSINSETLGDLSRTLDLIGRFRNPEGNCSRIVAQKSGYGGKEVSYMCKPCCERPEKLKGRPDECTPQQIRECHGEAKGHPCVGRKEEQHKE